MDNNIQGSDVRMYLDLVFSTLSGKASKSDEVAEELMSQLIHFLDKGDVCIFDDDHKERQSLKNKLTKAKEAKKEKRESLKIVYVCEYGCAILFIKPSEQSPIEVKMIAPELSTETSEANYGKLTFSSAHDYRTVNFPPVLNNEKSLAEFLYHFRSHFEEALMDISRVEEDKLVSHSIKEIEEAIKKALNNPEHHTTYKSQQKKEQDQDDEKDWKKKPVSKVSEGIDLTNCNVNSSWFVVQILIRKLIQSEKDKKNKGNENTKVRVETIIIGFKAYLLEKVTKMAGEGYQKKKYNRKQISYFKRCLNQLIYEYRNEVSKNKRSKKCLLKNFQEIIMKINGNIIDAMGGKLFTSEIETTMDEKQKLNLEIESQPFLKLPEAKAPETLEVQLAKIIDFPFNVGKRIPFQELIELYPEKTEENEAQFQSLINQWLLLVEKKMFALADELATNRNIIDLEIHMREFQCEIGISNACQIVLMYEEQMSSSSKNMKEYYGMGMKGQNSSHIELIKTIMAILTFESVKMNRERKESNLNRYRVPIQIDRLNEFFVSHSYEARRAMQNVNKYYEWRKQRKELFKLDESDGSFREFASLVGEETRSAHIWVETVKAMLEKDKEILKRDIKLKEAENRIQYGARRISNPGCYSDWRQKTVSINVSNPTNIYHSNDPWSTAFLHNIPPDILGMIKIFAIAQNPKKEYKNQHTSLPSNHLSILNSSPTINNEEYPLNFFSHNVSQEIQTFSSNNENIVKQMRLTEPSNKFKMIFNNFTEFTEIKENKFHVYPAMESINLRIKRFLEIPNDDKNKSREHQVYANLHLMPNQTDIEDFQAICNTRSASYTQLMVLCKNILERKVISDSYSITNRLCEQVFLQTAGQLSTYNAQTERHFKQIVKVLKQFDNVWVYSDVTFCPLLGPFLGYMCRHLCDDGIIAKDEFKEVRKICYKLARRCLTQYERGEEDYEKNPELQIQWDQRFTITAAILCFREIKLTSTDEDEIRCLAKLIFLNRSCKILSDRQEKPQNKRQFQFELEMSLEKTRYYNIEVIVDHMFNHQEDLNEIVQGMNNGFPMDSRWEKIGVYEFRCTLEGGEVYQINLYKGCLFINGKELSCLDKVIKENPLYQEIFGKTRQFKVIPSRYPLYLRTQKKVNHQFKISKDQTLVFLEFGTDGKSIRYILKNQNQGQQIWELLNPKQLKQESNCYFPQTFTCDYLPWLCREKRCIVFRKKKFDENIFEMGLVIHLVNQGGKILKNFLVNYHGKVEDQDHDRICARDNDEIYERVILRKRKENNPEKLKAFSVLKKFQDPHFVIQLKNHQTKERYLWLHRYQIRFRVQNDQKLISENHNGYEIDFSYLSQQNCIFNLIDCLILVKDETNQLILNNHKRIVLISDGRIEDDGKIWKSRDSSIHIDSFKYDIHDFFKDIRGGNRVSQLHLSAVFLSINNDMKISTIEMTPLEYSIYILKTCLTNRPLTFAEQQKLSKLFQMKNYEISLFCEVIYNASIRLQHILSFKKENKRYGLHIDEWKQFLDQAKIRYEEKVKNNTLNHYFYISEQLRKFIGLSDSNLDVRPAQRQSESGSESDRSSSSSSESDSDDEKSNMIWNGLKPFRGQIINNGAEIIKNMYESFEKEEKQLRIDYSSSTNNNNNNNGEDLQEENDFPAAIEKQTESNNGSEMMKDMIEELKESYKTFISQESQVNRLKRILDTDGKSKLQSVVECLLEKGQKCEKQIEKIFDLIKIQNQDVPDIITGIQPTLSPIFYTKILCERNLIFHYFQDLDKNTAVKNLKIAIKYWMALKTRLASLERVRILLKNQKVDVVAFMREVYSPRERILEKKQWLSFQCEMKVQVWPSQLETYENLMNEKDLAGPYCQLNMGQGKTQLIIPMMILHTIFSKDKAIPRVNLLTSLYEQARGNFFRFLSVTGFQIPGFEIPFTRDVQLNKKNIYKVRDMIKCFSKQSYILMSRESRLSEILRYHENATKSNSHRNGQDTKITLDNMPLIGCQIFDIFDEIDAMMTPKRSYIFSIGNQIELPSAFVRLELIRVCLQTFLQKMMKWAIQNNLVTSDETEEDTMSDIQKGIYPAGLRLIMDSRSQQQVDQFRREIASSIINDVERHQFSFCRKLSHKEKECLIDYIVRPQATRENLSKKICEGSFDQIYLLRGSLAYKILEHCLSMRCGVSYGVPGEHAKKIAVPYEAADIPSKTSEYEHPDVSAYLSIIAYCVKGLNQTQFNQALRALMILTDTSKRIQYEKWMKILSEAERQNFEIKNAKQINLNSKADRDKLFEKFRKNRAAIFFWLSKCVFPRDLQQYCKSICSSAFDLADVKRSVGFSGTKDNRFIFPYKLNWKPCKTPAIKGTDGKMIYQIIHHTNQVCVIAENQQTLWQRFVELSLKKGVGCIIDAGALCVGRSLKNDIVPWIADHENFDGERFSGISFCDESGKWQVYDCKAKFFVDRGTTIPDHQTFVIFDEARTRGADLKMDANVVAVLSLGPDITKDKFMQAAGRLRKFGRNQTIIIMATHQIFASIPSFPKDPEQIDKKLKETPTGQLSELILAWCCLNSKNDNENLLLQYASLGWKHTYSKIHKKPHEQDLFTELKDMYEGALLTKSAMELNEQIANRQDEQVQGHETGRHICEVLKKYGAKVMKQAGTLDDVCEREVETEKEREKQQENGMFELREIPETDQFITEEKAIDLPYIFDTKFKVSKNFIKTTDKPTPDSLIYGSPFEIPQTYFIRYNKEQFVPISCREASTFIKKHIMNKEETDDKIQLMASLAVSDEFIRENSLQAALVDSKFLSGIENYTLDEQEFLLSMLVKSIKGMEAQGKHLTIMDALSTVLKRKRVHQKKFLGSTLEKMIIRLVNQGISEEVEEGEVQVMTEVEQSC